MLIEKKRVKEKYVRAKAEKRFARVYQNIEGNDCCYCGIESDGGRDHQPPVYVLHRFADGGLVTKKMIRERFGQCKIVPCCTICNMGLGAYHGVDDNDRRREILNWFLLDERFPEDALILKVGEKLINARLEGTRGTEIYEFPGVGRFIYIEALWGLINGEYASPAEFPEWLKIMQSELTAWLKSAPKRKSQYFLDMANLVSYDLVPDARDNPRGQH